ncbi:glycosyltransferase family 4 protein [Polaribacter sp. Z022]|uniref:MraY family glycosyltransferase n=1 Tax=Polaribacter sp. Z022 TaxID=2927125 RepID=UPI00202225F5|nr:glycosyltransferase family 4 protein [Polaribacter sp. Z022]MCL7754802.1 glycosyltransferase family 4 protein [Polaribacter sp. Z022]
MNIYLIVLVSLIVASYVYLKLAVKFKIIDKPNQRSSHTKITVRGGGIIFPIAILLFYFFNDYQYTYFVLGVFLLSVISFLDDIYTLSSKIRFPFQLIGVLLTLYQIGVTFLPISSIILFIFLLMLGVGIVNMFNFMDGINGITGIYSLSVLSGFFMVNYQENLLDQDLIIYVGISILVFGFYNFRKKALFFAGDIGSISLGVLVVFLGLFLAYKLSAPIIIMIVMVYGADAGCTLLYRKFYTNESIFDPHRHHMYQKLVDVYKIPHLNVSIIYAVLQMLINIVVLKTYHFDLKTQILVFLAFMFFFIFCYILLFKKIKKSLSLNNAG